MSDWHVSFGLGEDWGSYLSWGFAFIAKVKEAIKKVIGELVRRVKKKQPLQLEDYATIILILTYLRRRKRIKTVISQ